MVFNSLEYGVSTAFSLLGFEGKRTGSEDLSLGLRCSSGTASRREQEKTLNKSSPPIPSRTAVVSETVNV